MLEKKVKIKTIILLLLLSLIIQSTPITSYESEQVEKNPSVLKHIDFSIDRPEFKILTDMNYSIIVSNTMNTSVHEYGKPEIPIMTKTLILPLRSTIESIQVEYQYDKTIYLEKKLKPAAQAIPKIKNMVNGDGFKTAINFENTSFYSSSQIYPNKPFDYSVGCGLQNGSRVLFLNIHLYPISYIPAENIIKIRDMFQINVSYATPIQNKSYSTQYDMIIISPLKFIPNLQPLVIHKSINGIKTKIKSLESIYLDSISGKYDEIGRDHAEKIKYFIKYAIEEWNISYVLLIGGHKKQKQNWYMPVRYSNLHDRSFWNDSYVTDLYFSDIYRYNQSTYSIEFEDWDSNNNDIFGEWTWIFDAERGWWYDQDKKDELDLYPDVHIGRLACRDSTELKTMVSKIIRYERKTYNKEWFKKIICVAGDTVPYSDGICEGEIETGLAADYLSSIGFDATKLWITNGNLLGPKDVKKEINQGAGFIYLSGHGTPLEWCTHPISDGDAWIDVYAFQLKSLINRNKLPICIVGGCHNSQFDVSFTNMIKGLSTYGLSYFFWDEGIDCFGKWTWAPECWSWNLVSQRNGGFIACIGNTGLGWGVGGENCVDYNEGYLNTQFFKTYAELYQDNIHHLGIIHTENINNYITHFSANDHLLDRKTVEQWVLLGDPSLTIGGFP